MGSCNLETEKSGEGNDRVRSRQDVDCVVSIAFWNRITTPHKNSAPHRPASAPDTELALHNAPTDRASSHAPRPQSHSERAHRSILRRANRALPRIRRCSRTEGRERQDRQTVLTRQAVLGPPWRYAAPAHSHF